MALFWIGIACGWAFTSVTTILVLRALEICKRQDVGEYDV